MFLFILSVKLISLCENEVLRLTKSSTAVWELLDDQIRLPRNTNKILHFMQWKSMECAENFASQLITLEAIGGVQYILGLFYKVQVIQGCFNNLPYGLIFQMTCL